MLRAEYPASALFTTNHARVAQAPSVGLVNSRDVHRPVRPAGIPATQATASFILNLLFVAVNTSRFHVGETTPDNHT